MENKILEIKNIDKRLPDYVFLKQYPKIYFFEMPMPQNLIHRLIDKLISIDNFFEFRGILLEPFDVQNEPILKLKKGTLEPFNKFKGEEKEITWAYNIGYFRGSQWAIYYEFNVEVLLVGVNYNNDDFEESIRRDSVLINYNYSLDELISYFGLITKSSIFSAKELEGVCFLNKLRLNYTDSAKSIVRNK